MATKADLVAGVRHTLGLSKKEAEVAVAVVFGQVLSQLDDEGEAVLPGIGKLKIKYRAGRLGHNPRTGESIAISPRNVLKLSVTKALKEDLNPSDD